MTVPFQGVEQALVGAVRGHRHRRGAGLRLRYGLRPPVHLDQRPRMRHLAELPHGRQVHRDHGVLAQAVQGLAGPDQQHRAAALVHAAAGGAVDAVHREVGRRRGRGESTDPLGEGQHGDHIH
ncbi:hypothetical protein [Nonomuraea sp. NPDC001699]